MILRLFRQPFRRFSSVLGYCSARRPTTKTTIIDKPISFAVATSSFQQSRCFAKGIGRGGDKKPHGITTDQDVTDLVDLADVRTEMRREIELLREDFIQQVSVRANLQAFERLVVKLPDNSEVPLNHLAQVSFKNPQLAIVNLTASPHAVRSVADALIKSGLCPNPQIQTTVIYVPLAKPTREHRENLVKTAKLLYNRCHDRLRAVDKRHQIKLRQFERTAPIDTYRNAQTVLHTIMKEFAHQAEEMMKAKQKELMEELK